MKKMMIMLLVAASVTNAEAQSMLKVYLADNSPLNVAVDGRYFNKRGTSVTVGDLPPGKHFVQIYSVSRNGRGRMREEIIYEGKVKTVFGMVTLLGYDAYSRNTDVQQQDINAYVSQHPAVQRGIRDDNGRNQDGNSYDQGGGYNNSGDNNYSNGNGTNYNGSSAASPVTGSLTQAKIDNLKTTVAAKKTDTEKMNTMKAALKDEQLTTDQVGMMFDWFSFESAKVEFAEWAWNNTVDKASFGTLEGKFTYKNYQDELEKFLQSKN